MANVLCSRARLVSYLPCLHVLVRSVAVARTGPAAEALDSDKLQVIISPSEPGPLTDPNENLGPFGPQDQRFLLPGKVGFDCLPEQKKTPVHQKMFAEVLSGRSSSETQKPLINQLMGDFCEGDEPLTPQNVTRAERYFDESSVECAVQLCPELLKKDFQSMFPEAPPTAMMVVTVTQRTQNEMTSWSAEVEQEREQMLDRFVEGAKEICFALQREGFWADFIEPSSGLAFFGSYTNNTLFETDDRYRHLGFQIEDLGCCRVVRHALWGTRVFVGSIFTDAPPDGRVMAMLHGNGRSCQNST